MIINFDKVDDIEENLKEVSDDDLSIEKSDKKVK